MTQKLPRNTLLHERNHKRKAGPHGGAKRPEEKLWWQRVIDEIVDELIEEERALKREEER